MHNLYLAALCAVVPGLGRKQILKLTQRLGGARAVFEADAEALLATGLARAAAVENFIANRSAAWPQKIAYFCRQEGVRLVAVSDEDYPSALRQTSDPPLVLYVKGELPRTDYCLAVVGSRDCTAYGERAASYFAAALARQGIPIISGGARGIDTAAHEGCLSAGGRTVAVMGCGLDTDYPPENGALFHRIVRQQGALVTEYPPGVAPLPSNFPARNRIIVGMSRGVLVAEAARRSGALITANIAADEGRDVYCVPGNIFDHTSIGCHDLIRTGAKLVDTPQDILEDKNDWELHVRQHVSQPTIFDAAEPEKDAPAVTVTELGGRLLQILQGGACTLEELTERSGADFAAVSMELLELQAAGLADVDQAQRYYRR